MHKRSYGAYEDNELANKVAVTGLLVQIVDKYTPMTASEVLHAMNHSYCYFFDREENIKEKSFEVVIERLRHSKVGCFEGLTPPLRFRNKYEDTNDV